MEQDAVFFVLIIDKAFLGGNSGVADHKGIDRLWLEQGIEGIFDLFIVFDKFYFNLIIPRSKLQGIIKLNLRL